MSFLDDLNYKLSQLSNDTVNKTKTMSNSYKLQSDIKKEENKISELFSIIGEKYYNNHSDPVDDDMQVLFEQMKVYQKQLEQYKKELNLAKNIVECPHCGEENSNSSDFCSKCGTKLIKFMPESHIEKRVCSNCGAILNENQIFCSKCGRKYDNTIQTEDKIVSNELIESEHIKTQQPKELFRICPTCGKKIKTNQIFCTRCGTKYEEKVQNTPLKVESNKEKNNILNNKDELETMKCPNCGSEIEKNKKFCTICGTPLVNKQLNQMIAFECPNCGKILKKGQNFCINCGHKL